MASEINTRRRGLDVASQPIARVYAKAYLGAAQSAGRLDDAVEELGSLVDDVLDRFPDLDRMLKSSMVSEEDKLTLIDRVFGGQASQTLLAFLKVLCKHGRLDVLRPIRAEVETFYNKLKGRVEVHVRTASPLDETLRREIHTHLQQMLKAEPVVKTQVDPSLVGGLVISVGDTVYDGSVITRLNRARTHMIERNIDEILTSRERFLQSLAR